MPLKGEKFEELLSGFLDGELTGEELQAVEEQLAADPSANQQLEALRLQKQRVRQLGDELTAQRGLPAEFSQRVLAAAVRHAAELNSPEDHHASSALPQKNRSPFQTEDRPRWSRRALATAASLALVAAILVAISIPKLLEPQDVDVPLVLDPRVPTGEPESELPIDAESTVEYVVEQEAAKINYVLVCDVQIKRDAQRNNRLAEVFTAAGIHRGTSVRADTELQKTLGDTRMIVQPEEPSERESIFYFVRADMVELSNAIDLIWRDKVSFPNVRLDLAFDHPRVQLVREILRRSARQAASGDPLAVPLAAPDSDTSASIPSPFPSSAAVIKYISVSSRSRGWDAADTMAPANTSAYLLFVGHIVD